MGGKTTTVIYVTVLDITYCIRGRLDVYWSYFPDFMLFLLFLPPPAHKSARIPFDSWRDFMLRDTALVCRVVLLKTF